MSIKLLVSFDGIEVAGQLSPRQNGGRTKELQTCDVSCQYNTFLHSDKSETSTKMLLCLIMFFSPFLWELASSDLRLLAWKQIF